MKYPKYDGKELSSKEKKQFKYIYDVLREYLPVDFEFLGIDKKLWKKASNLLAFNSAASLIKELPKL